ncbi:MAG: radical SAM protein [Gammaproteobacteria bacterium]|nr:radical SAM protein [Gammaproteobacteria bacterium]
MGVSIGLLYSEGMRSVLSPLSGSRASNIIRPTIAAVYITKSCNSQCNFCDFWKHDKDPGELSSEQWGIVFSKLKAFGVRFVGVNASGEMFSRKDVFEILQHLNDLGLIFNVNTNGLNLTQARSERLARLQPRQITIGMDGVGDQSYFATRGIKNGFTKVSKSIDSLMRAGARDVSIGSVLMIENMGEWVKLAEFAHDKGLSGVRFTAYHDAYFNPEAIKEGCRYQEVETRSLIEHEIDRLIEIKRKTGIVKNSIPYLMRVKEFYRNQKSYFPVPCIQGSNRIEIDIYGNVTLCSFMTNSLGNLIEKEMEDIWNSTVHRKAREAAFRGDCPHCFLSCYAEENLRLSKEGFVPTLSNSLRRGIRLLGR